MKRSGESAIADLIIGAKGRFATAFANNLSPTAITINNPQENQSLEFIKKILSDSQKTKSKVNIYWCLGKSKSKSEKKMY